MNINHMCLEYQKWQRECYDDKIFHKLMKQCIDKRNICDAINMHSN